MINNTFSQTSVLKVIGVGGAGGNAVNRMIESDIRGIEYVSINTDCQVLRLSKAETRVQIGKKLTQGLGAGADPEVGYQSALEDIEDIKEVVSDANLVFITCGMGGGTGTGASKVVAQCAREAGAIVVGIVTKPFSFEGKQRMRQALAGINELRPYCDTLLVIPNDKILSVIGLNTTYLEAFAEADNVLRRSIQSLTEIITLPGHWNVDFNDVKKIVKEAGTCLMGIGIAEGPNRAIEAARLAIQSPLLEIDITGATKAIVQVTADQDIKFAEVQDIYNEIRAASSTDIDLITGFGYNLDLKDEVVVTVIASGYDEARREQIIFGNETPVPVKEEVKPVVDDDDSSMGDDDDDDDSSSKQKDESHVPSWLLNR